MLATLDPANRQLRLIPLLKEKCELPVRIGYLTYVNFADPDDPAWPWTQLLTGARRGAHPGAAARARAARLVPAAPLRRAAQLHRPRRRNGRC